MRSNKRESQERQWRSDDVVVLGSLRQSPFQRYRRGKSILGTENEEGNEEISMKRLPETYGLETDELAQLSLRWQRDYGNPELLN
jgi:hypothetical protein